MQLVLVTDLRQVKQNIAFLDDVRHSGVNNNNYVHYKNIIKRGICFFPYLNQDGLAFAPSRFIGYLNNSFDGPRGDGRLTNVAISALLGNKPTVNPELEKCYGFFCERLGFMARVNGPFGVPHKFWLSIQEAETLETMLAP